MIEALFFISVFALAHSYLLYPLSLWALGYKRQKAERCDVPVWPKISVIIAAYNEQEHIHRKIQTVLEADYPADQIEVLVGSDASSDRTNTIVDEMTREDGRIRLFPFPERRGKSAVLNSLAAQANGGLFVLTDAKVYLDRACLKKLAAHFASEQTGAVGANIISRNQDTGGIAKQEMAFMTRELWMKHREGQLWGSAMGLYGACYALRAELYSTIPEDYSVDDFYMSMQVVRKGKDVVMEMAAKCYENVPGQVQAEFRRKVRIAVGNYQNLRHFAGLMCPPWKGRAYAFVSHKALRWLGPFFILLALGLNIYLAFQHTLYLYLLAGQALLILASITDYLLRKIGKHVVVLRFISHFYHMNLALLTGFVMYIKGKRTNVWEPTKRKQD